MKTQIFNVKRTLPISQKLVRRTPCGRNLEKNQLGGVIFGCTRSTMNECLSKQLFGEPRLAPPNSSMKPSASTTTRKTLSFSSLPPPHSISLL
ncbi:hypothetical protein MTR_4g036205 [Medicago truncatula]|uniref:DCD domain-containing protein n=1 Tax=Medicago truncatula TaxID=3880 RepID=A0A072UI47_MEDTR|nr:hypothetical protein MTR_4g036205 [Medicago truncatula]